jgi:hypothetical protein
MTTGAILLIAQAVAAPATAPPRPADIELTARVRAREVSIAQEGPILLRLEVEPGVTDVAVTRNQPAGARNYRNLAIDARIAAWLSHPEDEPHALSTTTGEQPQ